jgi:hypothetical protein
MMTSACFIWIERMTKSFRMSGAYSKDTTVFIDVESD